MSPVSKPSSKNPFSSEFWKLSNTDLIVLLGFLVFVGVIFYFKVPAMITGMLDKRAEGIQSDLDPPFRKYPGTVRCHARGAEPVGRPRGVPRTDRIRPNLVYA